MTQLEQLLARPEQLDDADTLRTIADRLQLPVACFDGAAAQAATLVPERWARKFRVAPLDASDERLRIATADPFDVDCERALAFATGRSIDLALAGPTNIGRWIEELYTTDAPVAGTQHADVELLTNEQEMAPPTAGDDAGASSVISLVDELVGAGIASRASDIHIEPDEAGIVVRHRIDGVLHPVRRLPRTIGPALVSRIKIMSRLNIADRLRPQDGRARVAVNGAAVDLRVSTLPASHGEKVVLRVLDSRATVLALDAMGFNPDELERVDRLLQVREGLILVTGPTGSGKTTTLYAALRQLQSRGVNIVTVEDPIEYRLAGIVQVQVHERAGLTFASALRSIMRQDPDVLLIGEVRDRETAEIAIQASLTGHLVLSTLHTNDAASAVTRLADIGVAPYKIAAAVKGVLAQRLLRRVCIGCRGAGAVAGCGACGGTGFRGRLAIVEVLLASPEFERLVAAGASPESLADAGRRADGTSVNDTVAPPARSLWQSGLEHVRRGETTLDELLRVAAPDDVGRRSVREPLFAGAALLSGSAFELIESPFRASTLDSASRSRYLPQRVAARLPSTSETSLADIATGTVDVYVIRPRADGWRVLVLQRASDTRCPTAWEAVHGRIELDEEPEDAALREVGEETGLSVARLYNVTVQPFYLHRSHTIQMAVVFAALVDEPAHVTLGAEHQSFEWLEVDAARRRFQWPREVEALDHIQRLLATGDAGPAEDVLRVR